MFSQTFPENREGLFSCFKKLSPMKKIIPFSAFILFLLSSMLSSCAVVGGIFKTGMGFGIFIVVVIIIIIAVIVMRTNKK